MSEITETEIYSMSKVQNYMRGYKDGKSDTLDKIKAEILNFKEKCNASDYLRCGILEIIDKYNTKNDEKQAEV